jgi:hypothetical protein
MIISDQALWPKLQGKLNRELRVYKGNWPFWQSAGGLAAPCRSGSVNNFVARRSGGFGLVVTGVAI